MEHILKKDIVERAHSVSIIAPKPPSNSNQTAQLGMQAGMGFAMGFGIGTIMPTLHFIISGTPFKGKGLQILTAGLSFGAIFAFGSLAR